MDVAVRVGRLPSLGLFADSVGVSDSASGLLVSSAPSAENTGPRVSSLTTHSGDYTLAADETLSGVHVTGTIYCGNGSGGTIVDCKANAIALNSLPGGNYGTPPASGVTVSYCEVGIIGSQGADGPTIDHCRVGDTVGTWLVMTDLQGSVGGVSTYYVNRDWTITNNLFDRLPAITGSGGHYEAIHMFGVQGATIRNNVFDFRPASGSLAQITAVWNIGDGNGTGKHTTGLILDGNVLYGGGYYQVYLYCDNSQVTDNAFNSYSGMSGVQYPPTGDGKTSFTQSGNTLDGSALTLQTG